MNMKVDMTSYWFWFVILFSPVVIIILILYLPQVFSYYLMRRNSFRDSLLNGAVDEPHAVREMTDKEQRLFRTELS